MSIAETLQPVCRLSFRRFHRCVSNGSHHDVVVSDLVPATKHGVEIGVAGEAGESPARDESCDRLPVARVHPFGAEPNGPTRPGV